MSRCGPSVVTAVRALGWRMFSVAVPVPGQAANQETTKDEIIQKLLDRVDALEREVAVLQKGQAQPASAALPAAAEPAAEDKTLATVDTPPDNASRFTFHGYADTGFSRNADGTPTKNFGLGEVDLFATERLSQHLTALLE